jgi:hypothetical protein
MHYNKEVSSLLRFEGIRCLIICTLATLAYSADIVIFGTSLSDDGHGITPIVRDRLNNSDFVSSASPVAHSSRFLYDSLA